MKSLFPNWVVALVTCFITAQTCMFLTRPPRWILESIDSRYSDQCLSAERFGIRPGMSRREVLMRFGMQDAGNRSDWYIRDAALGLPPDALFAPVWPVGRLPDRLETASDWTLIRAGYDLGYDMHIHFEQDRVQCADVVYHVPSL